MQKKDFIKILETLKNMKEFQKESDKLGRQYGLDVYEPTAQEYKLEEMLVSILQSETNDMDELISYWLYEIDCGRLDDDSWPSLSTPEEVWEAIADVHQNYIAQLYEMEQ